VDNKQKRQSSTAELNNYYKLKPQITMLIGYARVSTMDQNLDLQIDALKLAGCEQIFTDKITGTIFERPQLSELKKILRVGDTIVVWKLDRMGRGLRDLINLMREFDEQKIGFKSLTEGIDTTTTTGKLIFHIFGALAEFERNLIIERTQAGLKAGRARGKIGGRPPKLSIDQKKVLKAMHRDKTIPLTTILETFKISKPTMYKIVNEVVNDGKAVRQGLVMA
jgi:DNA invertase Pin-like site-specific DNA recombinase